MVRLHVASLDRHVGAVRADRSDLAALSKTDVGPACARPVLPGAVEGDRAGTDRVVWVAAAGVGAPGGRMGLSLGAPGRTGNRCCGNSCRCADRAGDCTGAGGPADDWRRRGQPGGRLDAAARRDRRAGGLARQSRTAAGSHGTAHRAMRPVPPYGPRSRSRPGSCSVGFSSSFCSWRGSSGRWWRRAG